MHREEARAGRSLWEFFCPIIMSVTRCLQGGGGRWSGTVKAQCIFLGADRDKRKSGEDIKTAPIEFLAVSRKRTFQARRRKSQ